MMWNRTSSPSPAVASCTESNGPQSAGSLREPERSTGLCPLPGTFAGLFALLYLMNAGHLFAADPLLAADKVQFSRDILPILSDACYQCHGRDENSRKTDLRLDLEAAAKQDLGGYLAIKPGHPEESELISRITDTDPASQMPPPRANRQLSPREIALLKQWITEGAVWGGHWAFEPMSRPPLPAVKAESRIRQPIDRFLLSRLERDGLTFSPDAPKETWLRRVTLDLTGLPPTIAEIDAFLADASPQAFETVVDRLLKSPRYGERMASEWLDLARYSDTHGFQMDRYRAMWPYRDWVISAWNRNLPFNQFLTWQLAGDLLPNATQEQILATAFNRLHLQNEEGGIVAEEFRVAYVVDRVNTMGTAFLGLTFECARCHSHKFDPISQQDFYSLFAFFNNIDEYGQTTYFTDAMPVPTLMLTDRITEQKLAELRAKVATSEETLQKATAQAAGRFDDWLTKKPALSPLPAPRASFAFDALDKNQIANSINPAEPLTGNDAPQIVAGKVGQAGAMNGDNGFSGSAQVGAFTRSDPFAFSVWIRPDTIAARQVVFHWSKAAADAGSRGYELLLEEGHAAFGLHHMWPGNSLKVATKSRLVAGEWTHLVVSYDGSSRAAGLKLFLNGLPAELETVRDGLTKEITYESGAPPFQIGFRFRDNGFKGGQIDELKIFPRSLTALEAAQLAGRPDLEKAWGTPAPELRAEQRQQLQELYLAEFAADLTPLRNQLTAARTALSQAIQPIPEVMVMREMPTPRPAYVLKRGAYDAPGEPVVANTPAQLMPFRSEWPKNRLGLALWLTDPEQPLTARVTVNRAWQMLFGQGIVETSDNFGMQGATPTHPELLDWLARDFISHDWDYQRMLKMLVLSTAYRQSARVTPELLSKDPQNLLLGRGPAHRLSAEMLRDQALAVSGLLVEKLGGPSVRPYQPDGLWDVAMGKPAYNQGHGDDLHRRSLYTFWKRTVPPPTMVTFDAADRNVCVARRQMTSTPLQALALLNDVQQVEAARLLAQRMLTEGGKDLDARLTWAARTVLGRAPSDRELSVLRTIYAEQKAEFAAEPAAADKLLAVGEAKSSNTLDKLELATCTVVAQSLLNLDSAVFSR